MIDKPNTKPHISLAFVAARSRSPIPLLVRFCTSLVRPSFSRLGGPLLFSLSLVCGLGPTRTQNFQPLLQPTCSALLCSALLSPLQSFLAGCHGRIDFGFYILVTCCTRRLQQLLQLLPHDDASFLARPALPDFQLRKEPPRCPRFCNPRADRSTPKCYDSPRHSCPVSHRPLVPQPANHDPAPAGRHQVARRLAPDLFCRGICPLENAVLILVLLVVLSRKWHLWPIALSVAIS